MNRARLVYLALVGSLCAFPLGSTLSFNFGVSHTFVTAVQLLAVFPLTAAILVKGNPIRDLDLLIPATALVALLLFQVLFHGGDGALSVITLWMICVALLSLRSPTIRRWASLPREHLIWGMFLTLIISSLVFLPSPETLFALRVAKQDGFGAISGVALYSSALLLLATGNSSRVRWIVIPIAGAFLLLLGSRGALLGTAVALCVMLGARSVWRLLLVVSSLGVAGSITGVILGRALSTNPFLIGFHRLFFDSSTQVGDYSSGRIAAVHRIVQHFADSDSMWVYLFGFPLGTTASNVDGIYTFTGSNDYLLFLNEFGMVGVTLFGLLGLMFLHAGWRVLQRQRDPVPLTFATLFFFSAVHYPFSALPSWVVLVLLVFTSTPQAGAKEGFRHYRAQLVWPSRDPRQA